MRGAGFRKKGNTMKKVYLTLALCLGVSLANAQITTGETTSKVVRTGNRAKAGNAGIYVGASSDMFRNLFDKGMSFQCLPLINLKYMYTDQVEFRLGMEWWKKSTSSEQDWEDGVESKDFEKRFTFSPGVAYHFSDKNLLDVYVGGELPFGWGSKGGEYDGESASTKNFHIGLGAFIGLQAYLANLPVALGLEYGVSTSYSHAGDGYLSKDGLYVDTNEGYVEDFSQSQWKLGQQLRFTLSYYFDL